MPERRRLGEPAMEISDIDRYHSLLRIDKDDLDRACEEQPESFYHVADGHAQAIAKRDTIKLELEELEAKLWKIVLEEALDHSEKKPTDTTIKSEIARDQKVQNLQRKILDAKLEVDRWAALKDAFVQRSFMLREMVPLYLSRLQSPSLRPAREQMVDNTRARITEEVRRERVR
jgi:hypothetical protein